MDKTKGEGGSKGGRWIWLGWRGVGRGQKGEVFSGTTVKGIWAKPRGRVEAREGAGFGWGGGE